MGLRAFNRKIIGEFRTDGCKVGGPCERTLLAVDDQRRLVAANGVQLRARQSAGAVPNQRRNALRKLAASA